MAQIEETDLGEAVVQQVFIVTEKIGSKKVKVPVAGCRCNSGVLERKKLFRVVRNNEVQHSGSLFSLKHFKAEVEQIKRDMECGLALSDHSVDIQVGDQIICYSEELVQPTVEWNLPFWLVSLLYHRSLLHWQFLICNVMRIFSTQQIKLQDFFVVNICMIFVISCKKIWILRKCSIIRFSAKFSDWLNCKTIIQLPCQGSENCN